jgi:hypothetical protein
MEFFTANCPQVQGKVSIIFYAQGKLIAFPAPTRTKLTNDTKQYAPISYIEFHPNQKINVESMDDMMR